MCAMMPMLRVLSRGYSRATENLLVSVLQREIQFPVAGAECNKPPPASALRFLEGAARAADPERVSGYCSPVRTLEQSERADGNVMSYGGNPILMSAWSSVRLCPRQQTNCLPAVMRKGLVGLGHLVGVVLLLDRVSSPVRGVH